METLLPWLGRAPLRLCVTRLPSRQHRLKFFGPWNFVSIARAASDKSFARRQHTHPRVVRVCCAQRTVAFRLAPRPTPSPRPNIRPTATPKEPNQIADCALQHHSGQRQRVGDSSATRHKDDEGEDFRGPLVAVHNTRGLRKPKGGRPQLI